MLDDGLDRWKDTSGRKMGERAAFIVIDGPGHNHTRIALREGITSFGRLPSNDVILLGDLVSRNHARIIFFDGKASVQDLGSHNGSWVNDEKISTRALQPGDVVRIGNFRISFLRGVAGDPIADFVDEPTGSASGHGVPAFSPETRLIPDSATAAARPPVAAAATARPRGASAAPPPPPTARAASVVASTHAAAPPHASPRDPGPRDTEPPGTDLRHRAPGVGALARDVEAARSGDLPGPATLLLLYRVSEALARATDLADFLEQVLAFVLERLPSESAAVFRATGRDEDPVRLATAGPAHDLGPAAVSMSAVRWTIAKRFSVYSKDLTSDPRFSHGQSVADMPRDLRALVCAPIAVDDRVLGALYLSRSPERPYTEADVDLVEAIAHLVAAGLERIELRQRAVDDGVAREVLARTHSPDVVERILHDRRPYLEARVGTVCFCGIQGFVGVAERLPPEEVSEFLGSYLDLMTRTIFEHKGVVHSLLGDELVAVYGTPYAYGDDPARAVLAALELRDALDALVARRPGLGPLRLSVGVDTGRLLAGPVGPSRRLDYTVLGEAVRVAARLRALAPPGAVLVSAATRPLLPSGFGVRVAGKKQLRPRHEVEEVFEVTGYAPEDSRTELL